MFKNALVSVSDKTGLVDFLKPMVAQGLRVVSTGGTAQLLKSSGVPVVDISEQTGFAEVMDGRVKTLHPRVHMALLARDQNQEDLNLLKKEGLEPFDLVIVNLYPFEEGLKKNLDLEHQVELIDVGGPSMLRAAAKSFDRLTVVTDPQDYAWIAQKSETTFAERKKLAGKVFSHTAYYDGLIATYLLSQDEFPAYQAGAVFHRPLRYGENPHQRAAWYRQGGAVGGLHNSEILQGKELSYNNLMDLDAAITTLQEFSGTPAGVAIKHLNPCGVAVGGSSGQALERTLKADPVSVFGGIIAVNFMIGEMEAKTLSDLFLECIVAPTFTPEALEIFGKKKNLRLLAWPELMKKRGELRVRSVLGGHLVQSSDQVSDWSSSWKVIGESPTPSVKSNLLLAWKVCAHLKSNAIALAGDDMTVGLGMGQVNRVDAVEQALGRWKKHHPQVRNVVLASDAFFPFIDSVEVAAEAGVKWIIQPGGALRDEEVIQRCRDLGVNLVLTGQRHFQH